MNAERGKPLETKAILSTTVALLAAVLLAVVPAVAQQITGTPEGVRIDGDRLWDLKVNDGRFFKRVLIATAFFAAIFNSRYNNFLIL